MNTRPAKSHLFCSCWFVKVFQTRTRHSWNPCHFPLHLMCWLVVVFPVHFPVFHPMLVPPKATADVKCYLWQHFYRINFHLRSNKMVTVCSLLTHYREQNGSVLLEMVRPFSPFEISNEMALDAVPIIGSRGNWSHLDGWALGSNSNEPRFTPTESYLGIPMAVIVNNQIYIMNWIVACLLPGSVDRTNPPKSSRHQPPPGPIHLTISRRLQSSSSDMNHPFDRESKRKMPHKNYDEKHLSLSALPAICWWRLCRQSLRLVN